MTSTDKCVIKFDRNRKFLGVDSSTGVEIVLPALAPDIVSAFLADSPFPQRQFELGPEVIKASAEKDITFADGIAKVSFSGSASAFARFGVYFDSNKMLDALGLDDSIQPGMKLEDDPNSLFTVLRWGYDLKGSSSGSIALGAPGAITFGVDGSKEGLYAVVRRLRKDAGAVTAMKETINSWMLPAQINSVDDLQAGTWLIADVDGTMTLKLGAEYGYDFNWVQQAGFGGLKGDIGLRLQLGVSAALGFEASGKYAVVIGRDSMDDEDKHLRLRLFKQRKKGWNFALNANATVQETEHLPDKLGDFVKAIFGLHSAQIINDLGALTVWTDPQQSPPDPLAGLTPAYALNLLNEITSTDATKLFGEAKAKLLSFLNQWEELPHGVATLLLKLVKVEPTHSQDELAQVRETAKTIANADMDAARDYAGNLLSDIEFFRSPGGRWLEAAADKGILNAFTEEQAFTKLQRVSQVTGNLLGESGMEDAVLVKLQQYIEEHLNLNQVESISDAAGFLKLDEWLKSRLSAFLDVPLNRSTLDEIRKTIHLILEKGKELTWKTNKALTRKYGCTFSSTFQDATTRTALLDIVFDFAVPGVAPSLKQALTGAFDCLLLERKAGVALKAATLTHQIQRHAHVEVNLPFFSCTLDHINQALAKVNAMDADGDRLLVYELDADDIVKTKNTRISQLTIGGYLRIGSNQVRVHSTSPLEYSYSFRQVKKGVRSPELQAQLGPYVTSYFPEVFTSPQDPRASGSFQVWMDDLDQTVHQIANIDQGHLGNILISLELTLPGAVASGWLRAPSDKNASQYQALSLRLQSRIRQLIPFYYFQNVTKYQDLGPATVLLVYGAMPPWTPQNDVYWDFEDPVKRAALVSSQQTTVTLSSNLEAIYSLLAKIPGMGATAKFYKPDRAALLQSEAIAGTNDALLKSLLIVEACIIRGAREAGLSIARFIQDAEGRPTDAIAALSNFGSIATETFNDKIRSVYGGEAVQPLGTLVFQEAASTFGSTLVPVRALLDLIVVKPGATFNLPDFLNGESPSKEEILIEQRFTNWSV